MRLEPRSLGSRSGPRKARTTPRPAGRDRPPARPVPSARRVRRVAVPALFLAYPLIFGFAMSAEQFNFAALVSGSGPFVGVANYRAVLADPVTIAALRNTALFTVTSVVFQVVISLALAVLLNQKFFLGGVLRRLVLVPWLIPLVASGTIFAQLFGAQNSMINSALQHLGIIHSPIAWLIHYAPAMTALILVNIWAGLPFNTIVFYSGLQDLDPTLHEAAKVDGASAWQRFLHITLPLMRPVIAIVAMIGIIATVKVFDLVIVITGRRPEQRHAAAVDVGLHPGIHQLRLRPRGSGRQHPAGPVDHRRRLLRQDAQAGGRLMATRSRPSRRSRRSRPSLVPRAIAREVSLNVLGAAAIGLLIFPVYWALCVALENDPNFYATSPDLLPISFYSSFRQLHLLNSYVGLTLADSTYAVPLMVVLIRAYLVSLPHEVLEAARVDGCGELRCLWSVIVPIAAPGIVTASLFGFLGAWGDFLFALTLNSGGSVQPVTLGLYKFVGSYTTSWGPIMATVVLAAIPAAIVLAVAQKWVRGGLRAGALKG